MAELRSEEEQLEVVKRWWKENGTSLIAGAVLAAAGVFGWNAWQNYQEGKSEAASARYQQLINMTAGTTLEGDQLSAAQTLIDELTDDYGNTLYAELAQLLKPALRYSKATFQRPSRHCRTWPATPHAAMCKAWHGCAWHALKWLKVTRKPR